MLKDIVLKNTEINEEEYESHIKDDWWLSTDEAYLYNVIDEIIDDITQEEE
jgi:ATP-dependent protease ClpP protease subunit